MATSSSQCNRSGSCSRPCWTDSWGWSGSLSGLNHLEIHTLNASFLMYRERKRCIIIIWRFSWHWPTQHDCQHCIYFSKNSNTQCKNTVTDSRSTFGVKVLKYFPQNVLQVSTVKVLFMKQDGLITVTFPHKSKPEGRSRRVGKKQSPAQITNGQSELVPWCLKGGSGNKTQSHPLILSKW